MVKDVDNTLITLNGWLRIVPPDKCAKYNIYNGHPGLITKYPELKGKDPQQRMWENIHEYDTRRFITNNKIRNPIYLI